MTGPATKQSLRAAGECSLDLCDEVAGPLLQLEPVEAVDLPAQLLELAVACAVVRRNVGEKVVRAVDLHPVEMTFERDVDLGRKTSVNLDRQGLGPAWAA